MVSTERIMSYGRLQSEGPLDTSLVNKKPSISWPDQGCIRLEHLQFRYAADLPYVLNSITCDIKSYEKVCSYVTKHVNSMLQYSVRTLTSKTYISTYIATYMHTAKSAMIFKNTYTIHVIVVTQAQVLCLICIPEARGLRAYISGKARVPVLQLICYTSGTLKSAQT